MGKPKRKPTAEKEKLRHHRREKRNAAGKVKQRKGTGLKKAEKGRIRIKGRLLEKETRRKIQEDPRSKQGERKNPIKRKTRRKMHKDPRSKQGERKNPIKRIQAKKA